MLNRALVCSFFAIFIALPAVSQALSLTEIDVLFKSKGGQLIDISSWGGGGISSTVTLSDETRPSRIDMNFSSLFVMNRYCDPTTLFAMSEGHVICQIKNLKAK